MRDPIVPQLERDEYLAWEQRQEQRFGLHHGFVVAFAAGTIDHDTVSLTTSRQIEIDAKASDGSFFTTVWEEGAYGIGATQMDLQEVYARTDTPPSP